MAVIIMASIGISVSNHSSHGKVYSELRSMFTISSCWQWKC